MIHTLALAALLAAGAATTQLPRGVHPTHYDLTLEPDAAALRFQGQVAIELEVEKATRTITLHALELEFDRVRLGGREAKAALDPAQQTATFTFADEVPAGRHRLEIEYRGRIGTQAVGLFALDYPDGAGGGRALFTQFEAADARRALPCWDEPAHKATFRLSAIVPKGQMAVSNMPAREAKPLAGGRQRVEFEVTPRMSSYLLFFALGDFERATAQAGKVDAGVVALRGRLPQAAFALEASRVVLQEYDDYFGVPYPLPKLDNVAGPGRSQFFGAMENWGAIFTFEHALLVDPALSTAADRQAIFSTDAHEIAHQWFGNLVTMSWWDDLWLNEGFASWMAGRTLEKLHPEWKRELKAVSRRDEAMERDALPSSHPVVQHVETVAQTSQAFDSITYQKGESVIRMLEGWVGAEAWREGVRRYMKKHAYGNTVSDDLWTEVAAASGQPILEVAHHFTLQPGVPLVTVSEVRCAEGRTTATLAQGELRAQPRSGPARTWTVPVVLRTLDGPATHVLLRGGRALASVEGCSALLVNAGQRGYFRTRYEAPAWNSLLQALPRVPAVDQVGLLTDAWALGAAGELPLATFFGLAAALPVDTEPHVLGELAEILEEIDTTLGAPPARLAGPAARRQAFRAWAVDRLRPLLARTGWSPRTGEADAVAVLREDLVSTLSALGDEEVIAESRRRWSARGQDPSAVPAGLRKAIGGVVTRHADAAAWEEMRALARAETTPLVRDHLYRQLSVVEDVALTRRALELALGDEPGATSTTKMISDAAELHPDLALDFALAHQAEVDGRLDATSRSRYYARLGQDSSDPATLDKLAAYAEAHLAPGDRREVETARARIQARIRLRAERLGELDSWLAAHAPGRR